MQKIILSIAFIFIFAFCVSAQCADEADCRAKLSTASQMINKLLDVTKTQEQAIDALRAENEARARKNDIDKGIIEAQDKLIALLEKQRRRQLSVFFGLLKVRF